MTVTTSQIKSFLSQSFTNVKDLVEIDPQTVFGATQARTCSVLDLNGMELCIGAYSSSEDLEGEWVRFLLAPQVKKAFHF